MYNWKINIITGITIWERSMNLGILSLKCLGKELQSELVELLAGRETEAILWRVLFIQFQSWRGLSELSEILFLQKSDLGLFMSLLQKWHCLVYLDLLSCASDFLHMQSKYRRRTLPLIISGDIHGKGGWIFMDFDLTGPCLSSKALSVVWYCSHICDKSALGLVISSHFTMSH